MKIRLLLSLSAILIFSFYSYGQLAGNPDNWCREGFFTRDSKEFGVGWVKVVTGKRAYFYDDASEKCPDRTSCRKKAYVVSGDTIITNRTRGNYVCGWFTSDKGAPMVGWLRTADLEFPSLLSDASERAWTGEWKYGSNSINITPNKLADFLNVAGTALWKGFGDNVHIGELDGRAPYKNGLMEYSDGDGEFDCRATMQLVTGLLVVADNMNCGGANVTFSGIYWRSSKKAITKWAIGPR